MWIICSETINLGGGKFIAPEKKVQVPDILGEELIGKSVALKIETEPLTDYVASQQVDKTEGEADEEVTEVVETTTEATATTEATGK